MSTICICSKSCKKRVLTRGRLYAQGHNPNTRKAAIKARKGKPSWNKGLTKKTSPVLQKISDMFKGHGVSNATRELMSAQRTGVCTKAQKAHIVLLGKARVGTHHSEETKRKISEGQKGRKLSAEQVRGMVERRKSQVLPFRNTKPERAVKQFLESYGVKFVHHALVNGSNHRFDFFIPRKNTLIEVDGCYWHVCKAHCPLVKNDWRKSQVIRDLRIDCFAADSCFTLVRIWEHEIKQKDFSKLYFLARKRSFANA
jgi:G:T-mismatch repair DNA endonuclease (very short patch repair protein)